MSNSIFVNLPVSDLPKTKVFFEAIGYHFNPQFSDDTASCMVINDTIYAMMLTHPKFAEFTPRKIADAHAVSEVLIALSENSKEDVDRIVDLALKHGGTQARDTQDLGFMYSRAFADLDGHIWEYVWMNPAAMPA